MQRQRMHVVSVTAPGWTRPSRAPLKGELGDEGDVGWGTLLPRADAGLRFQDGQVGDGMWGRTHELVVGRGVTVRGSQQALRTGA